MLTLRLAADSGRVPIGDLTVIITTSSITGTAIGKDFVLAFGLRVGRHYW